MMRTVIGSILFVLSAAGFSGTAHAELPTINGTCPGNLQVHVDQGGPVYLDGREAKLKRFNDSYYEATSGRTTVSISITPDGSVSMSYTGPNRASGICQVDRAYAPPAHPPHHAGHQPRPPYENQQAPVAIADLPRYCRGEASARFSMRPADITTNMAIRQPNGFVVKGWFDAGKRTTFFTCRFDQDGRFLSVD